jgi:hypothetical protein
MAATSTIIVVIIIMTSIIIQHTVDSASKGEHTIQPRRKPVGEEIELCRK